MQLTKSKLPSRVLVELRDNLEDVHASMRHLEDKLEKNKKQIKDVQDQLDTVQAKLKVIEPKLKLQPTEETEFKRLRKREEDLLEKLEILQGQKLPDLKELERLQKQWKTVKGNIGALEKQVEGRPWSDVKVLKELKQTEKKMDRVFTRFTQKIPGHVAYDLNEISRDLMPISLSERGFRGGVNRTSQERLVAHIRDKLNNLDAKVEDDPEIKAQVDAMRALLNKADLLSHLDKVALKRLEGLKPRERKLLLDALTDAFKEQRTLDTVSFNSIVVAYCNQKATQGFVDLVGGAIDDANLKAPLRKRIEKNLKNLEERLGNELLGRG